MKIQLEHEGIRSQIIGERGELAKLDDQYIFQIYYKDSSRSST
jgi:hypothetical protein